MKRNLSRAFYLAAALVLMLSLSGCTLVFHVTGSKDYYEVNGSGIVDGPIAVDVSVKGLWPIWPDTLELVISGAVNPVSTSDAGNMLDVAKANEIELAIYDKLFNGGDNPFSEIETQGPNTDDEFSVRAVMLIPHWKEYLNQKGTTTAFEGISLAVLMPEQYPDIVLGLVSACGQIEEGSRVAVELSGVLTNEEKGSKLVGDLLIGVILNGTKE